MANLKRDGGKRAEAMIEIRSPKNESERMRAALCSTVDDLYPDGNGLVVVTGVLPTGERIYLGEVSETALYQKGVNPMALIDRVRFGARRGV